MLKILSKIYEKSINRINQRFDKNEIEVYRTIPPLISIGNLSLGGTGKTPFVIMLGKYLKEQNIKIGVIGKGYKRKSFGELLISDGIEIKTTPENSGDEMYIIAERLRVPVMVHNEKYLAAKSLEKNFDLDCILLDDGFQHRKLHRDIDIVLLDKRTLNKPYLIPKGRLREPLSSLNRADIICLMDVKHENHSQILENLNVSLIIECEKVLTDIRNLFTGSKFNYGLNDEFLIVSGIGNPESFQNLLKSNSFNIKESINLSDHYNYSLKTIKYLISRCNKNNLKYILTTEKDAIKIKNYGELFAKYNIDCFVVYIDLVIKNNKEKFFDYIMNEIRK